MKMPSSRPLLVLLVEDNLQDRFFITRTAIKLNLNISFQIVIDGQKAIHYLAGKEEYADRNSYPLPEAILSNNKMPFVTGIELLKWVKGQPDLEHIPFVMMSDSQLPEDVDKAKSLGVTFYFAKPTNIEGYEQILRQIVELID